MFRPNLPSIAKRGLRTFRQGGLKLAEAQEAALLNGTSPEPVKQVIVGGPFRIQRSATGGLPVYSVARNDGSWKTIVRKIEGDVVHFQKQLNAYLKETHIDPLKAPPQATLRPTNMNLSIKGKHTSDVKDFINLRGY
ncbi:mitochondrial large subunit ribosomal protein-domain-containing protein [Naematelia encephala]|uniref:Large ribosomal subunit protein mL49 n=1 Tax=Naematelia encephala TaxID=71784 RepID=A0A1Y2ADC1_9TREE|nr:mitochondrial large subunit ribosomal protein-domain-containing protein [Naematelia encephala]